MGEAKRRKQRDPNYGKVRQNYGKVCNIVPPLIQSGFSADFGWLVYQHLGEAPFRFYLTEFISMTSGVSPVSGKKDCYEMIVKVVSGVMSPANLALFASGAEKGAIATFEIDGSKQFAEECLNKLTTSPGATVRADFSRRFQTPKTKEDVIPLIFLAEEDKKDLPSQEGESIAPND